MQNLLTPPLNIRQDKLTIRRFLTGIAFSWGLLVNVYVMLFLLWRNSLRPLEFVNHVAHWISLSVLVLALVTLPLVRRWFLGVWLLPGILMFIIFFGQLWLPKPTPDVQGTEITAVTFNVKGYKGDHDETFAVIKDIDSDLVALQEFHPDLQHNLNTKLEDIYPYQASLFVDVTDGLAILSKYPFVEEPKFYIPPRFEDPDPRYGRAVIDINGQNVVIYAFHPVTLYFEPTTTHIEQTEYVLALIQQETYPVIVLCDCNNTPLSKTYSLLNAELNDSFAEQGFGFGLTFPIGDPDLGQMSIPTVLEPLIRIDYIWHSDPIVTLDAKVWTKGKGGTSDHYPVWARLVIPA